MLEKYLNKEVIIEEKLYASVSTVVDTAGKKINLLAVNRIEGMITDFDENFIELDNNSLINRTHIYRIILK